MRRLVVSLVLSLGSWAMPLHAAEVPSGLRTWLQALEAVPRPEQLRKAAGPELETLLDQVVRDPREATYARHRALSFLGLLDTPLAAARLEALVGMTDPSLRATAALAWAGGPGRRQPQQAWPVLDRLLRDPAPQVRAAAVRGLAMVADRKGARDRVIARFKDEKDAEVRAACQRTLQRLKDTAEADVPRR